MKLKFFFEHAPWNNTVNIYLIGQTSDGKNFVAEPVELKFKEQHAHLVSEPTLKVTGFESSQILPALANALAESGFRAESTDAGELKATKKHLEDMRLIALGNQIEKTDT